MVMTSEYACTQNKHQGTDSQRTTLEPSLSTLRITWYSMQSPKTENEEIPYPF